MEKKNLLCAINGSNALLVFIHCCATLHHNEVLLSDLFETFLSPHGLISAMISEVFYVARVRKKDVTHFPGMAVTVWVSVLHNQSYQGSQAIHNIVPA